jgi:hypothetical protein
MPRKPSIVRKRVALSAFDVRAAGLETSVGDDKDRVTPRVTKGVCASCGQKTEFEEWLWTVPGLHGLARSRPAKRTARQTSKIILCLPLTQE